MILTTDRNEEAIAGSPRVSGGDPNPDTLAFLEKYIALDDRGKAIVNATLEHEYEFVKGTSQEKHA